MTQSISEKPRPPIRSAAAAAALALVLCAAGCKPGEAPRSTETPVTGSEPEAPDASRSDGMQRRIAEAVADLAERTDMPAGDIRVVEAESVTWRDGALGCPEPGMMYTQALVPGYRIVLEVGGERHLYHGARGREPFFCPPDRAGKPLPPDAGAATT
ncbi:MAG: hypothetical protein R3323_05660 [Wenzhouxiangellaceae bacterium]|nr:hypothetical protein [Wenzhouxiangellaceae bacterium]